MTQGVYIGSDDDAAEQIVARWVEITARKNEMIPEGSWAQGKCELEKAGVEIG